MAEFIKFPKIPHSNKEKVIVTEKLDGINGQIAIITASLAYYNYHKSIIIAVEAIPEDPDNFYMMLVGSHNRYITPEQDNFGFATWVKDNSEELFKLGDGRHYGEWYGKGIQRGYGLEDKRFALFDALRFGAHNPNTPKCCEVVTILESTSQEDLNLTHWLNVLHDSGSVHVEGFLQPEGVVATYIRSGSRVKRTLENTGGKWKDD